MKVTVCHNITDSDSSKDQEEIVINLRFGSLIYLYSTLEKIMMFMFTPSYYLHAL